MIAIAAASIVLPHRQTGAATLLIAHGRIVDILEGQPVPSGAAVHALHDCLLAPGFIDVHVHGMQGADVLNGADALQHVAAALPHSGVTAFCPTSVACAPGVLQSLLEDVRLARRRPQLGAARVLPAHLESNFINPVWNGAQPAACLRLPPSPHAVASGPGDYSGDDVLRIIEAHHDAVAIVTVAPELPGGLALVQQLRDLGIIVSIGHSGATFDEACRAIDAGVTHATHLFNRMTPLTHRDPGVVGAVLASPQVRAEILADGHHVHPAVMRVAIAAKGIAGIMAITDGTAGSGLPVGTQTTLGGQRVTVTDRWAALDDGTLAGSVSTMEQVWNVLTGPVGLSPVDAARACATTPAEQLRLAEQGRLVPGALADIVALGPDGRVRQTWVDGVAALAPPDRA
ncbi:MAG: N-acetylglucosamine-6-phosphate deacetylase [Acidobacteria bacterium]|nr:N-acetylglucosamine-6-phosphate deacetylase [Acidobacteriota bacterium]